MPLHKHFQTVIHAAADKIPPIIFPSVVNLISTILYKSHKNPVCSTASYLFRLVLNVQEKRRTSWPCKKKEITDNYIHNSSLWQIPSLCPVVLDFCSRFMHFLLILMTQLTEKHLNRTKVMRRVGIRVRVCHLD